MAEPLLDLFRTCGQLVVARRLEILAEMSALLHRYDILFNIDATRFASDRLYTALVLHIQERVGTLMGDVVAGTSDLPFLAAAVERMTACLTGGGLARINNNDPPVRVIDAGALQRSLCGEDLEAGEQAGSSLLEPEVFGAIRDTGFSGALRCGTGLIVLNAEVAEGDVVRNHSDSYHLFTIFTDHVCGAPMKTAEAIIHENAHNVLNLFLEAHQIRLATDHFCYYSPWTASQRHDRGIVHGFFAFSTVLTFYRRLGRLEHHEAIQRYAAVQAEKLASVEGDLRRILPAYPPLLADILMHAYAETRADL